MSTGGALMCPVGNDSPNKNNCLPHRTHDLYPGPSSVLEKHFHLVQGVKLTYVSGNHLAPKYLFFIYKVVTNSKKLVTIFLTQIKYFYAVN